MTTIPDHVGREAVRLILEQGPDAAWRWPRDRNNPVIHAMAKLLMNPPAPMTDPDEEAAKRVLNAGPCFDENHSQTRIRAATEQIRKEFAARKEAWEAGR